MLLRLDVSADSPLRYLVIQDNLAGIAIKGNALSQLVFGGNDQLFAIGELNRTLGRTVVRVELAYGRLNCEPRHGTGPGRAGFINDDQHDLAVCDFRLGSNALLIRHRAGQRHFHTRNTINRKSAGALHLDNHRSVSTPNSGYGMLLDGVKVARVVPVL